MCGQMSVWWLTKPPEKKDAETRRVEDETSDH